MKVGPYRISIRTSALIVPGICTGYGLYQYLNVRQLPDSKINLVLIEPVFVMMVFFTLWVLVREVEFRREKAEGEPEADNSSKRGTFRLWLRSSSTKKVGGFMLLSGLYLGLVEPVGFILCNFAFLVAGMLLLGVRSWPLLVILPAAATAVIYLLFQVWMQIPVPAGFLDFLP